MILRNPVIWLTGWIVEFAWGLLGLLLTRSWGAVDGYVTEAVSQDRHIDIERVDMNLVRRASDVPFWLTVLSWLLLLIAIGLFGFGLLVSIQFAIIGVVVGFAPVVPFAFGTLSERDELIAENIRNVFSSRDDVQHGCLVVGRRHMPGVIDELKDTEVDVVDIHKSKSLRRNK